jgi:hypothetical protein
MPFDTTLSSWILSRVLYHVSQLNSPFAESHVINDLKDCFSYVLLKDCFSYVLLDYQFIHVVLTLRNGLRMQASSDQTNVQSLDQTNVHLFLSFSSVISVLVHMSGGMAIRPLHRGHYPSKASFG